MLVTSDNRNGLNFSIVNSFLFSAMQLILVPVPGLAPYGIDLQNPHLTDADFSWLCHIPNANGQMRTERDGDTEKGCTR